MNADFGSRAVGAGDGVRLLSGSAAVDGMRMCRVGGTKRVVYIFLVLGINTVRYK